MDHERVIENSSSATVYTLPNTIVYLKGIFEYQTETDPLNEPLT